MIDDPHIEVHNYLPPTHDAAGEEEPPWFQAHREATDKKFRTLSAAMAQLGEGLKKFFAEEGEEPEHHDQEEAHGSARRFTSEDRRLHRSNDGRLGISLKQMNNLHRNWRWPVAGARSKRRA
jgi:hypothetical protein